MENISVPFSRPIDQNLSGEPNMARDRNEANIEMAVQRDQKPADQDAEIIEAVDARERYSSGRDKAAQLLKEAGHSVVVTPEENKRILRKVDIAILPIILVIYCLQSLDKTALSYASVFGLIDDTNLQGQEYSWLGAIVRIPTYKIHRAVRHVF